MLGLPPLAIVAAICIGAAVGGFFVGMDYKGKQVAEQENEALREQAKAISGLLDKYNAQAQELENARQARTVIYRDIEKAADRISSRPAYNTACIDDDGVRLLNEALTGKRETSPTGVTDAAMPPADRAGRKNR
jgi:preprotein translocase subunit SecF